MAPRRPKSTKSSHGSADHASDSRRKPGRGDDRRDSRRDGSRGRGSRSPSGPVPAIDAAAVMRVLTGIAGGGTAAQVGRLMGLSGDSARALGSHFRELVSQGQVLEVRPGRYLPSGAGGEHSAIIEAATVGSGLQARLPEGEVVPVDPRMTIGARAGDVC